KASTTVPGEMPDTQTDDLTRLPWSAQEAQAAADEAGEDGVLLALGFEANRTLATDEALGRYRVVHFATHGVLDTHNPELSGLALSRYDATGRTQPSFLRLHDIYPLEWQSELVVLSGCRTALGPTVRGEGVVGLARGFLHTGARQVVASLWSVRDRATAELMRRFYQGLFRQRLTPAAALQQAQRSMWQQHRWRDPYFWAPFILIGDWQATEATP
ncbi:MAG: CHAT domain-containing protein, partial [Acidobacteriota bacterium]